MNTLISVDAQQEFLSLTKRSSRDFRSAGEALAMLQSVVRNGLPPGAKPLISDDGRNIYQISSGKVRVFFSIQKGVSPDKDTLVVLSFETKPTLFGLISEKLKSRLESFNKIKPDEADKL